MTEVLPPERLEVSVTETTLSVAVETREDALSVADAPALVVEVNEGTLSAPVALTLAPEPLSVVVEAAATGVIVAGEPEPVVLTVEVPGPKGDPGPQGIQGVQGLPGQDGDKHHAHVQAMPSAVWEWSHGLNKYPSVRTFGTDGVEVEGDLTFPDANTARVEFGGAMSGTAYSN